MDIKRLMLIIVPIVAFIIAQYTGISVISIIDNDSIRYIEHANSGLVAKDVGSNIYIAWSDLNNGIMLASNSGSRFKIDSIESNYNFPMTRSMDGSGSNLYITWIDDYLDPRRLLLTQKNKEVNTILLRESKTILDYPIVIANGPVVYVAWLEFVDDNYEVMMKVSYDNGKTFSDAINVSKSKGNSSAITLDAEGSNVYIAWHEVINNEHKVILKVSYDNGKTFSDTMIMNEKDGAFPNIHAEGSNVYLTWLERGASNKNNLVLRISNDSAKSFGKAIRFDNESSTLASMDVDGALFCISWFSNALKIACTIDNENFVMHEIAHTNIKMHRLDVEGSDVYLSWIEKRGDSESFNLSISHDAGKSFSKPITLAIDKDINRGGVIANGNDVYAIWSKVYCFDICKELNVDVYAKVSTDAGSTFSKEFKLGS